MASTCPDATVILIYAPFCCQLSSEHILVLIYIPLAPMLHASVLQAGEGEIYYFAC